MLDRITGNIKHFIPFKEFLILGGTVGLAKTGTQKPYKAKTGYWHKKGKEKCSIKLSSSCMRRWS